MFLTAFQKVGGNLNGVDYKMWQLVYYKDKVTSSNMSRLEACAGFFRLLMKAMSEGPSRLLGTKTNIIALFIFLKSYLTNFEYLDWGLSLGKVLDIG